MNLAAIGYYIGQIMRIEGALMAPALIIALARGESASAVGFGAAIAALEALGAALAFLKRKMAGGIYSREGFVTVALSWIVMSLFGALPFLISGAIPNFIDCVFETVSGFTTTGASILSDVEALPMSLLYWRSFTHWVGGMGVLVFMLAIIPMSKGRGDSFKLLRAESPGPVVGKLAPKLRRTARILYAIYIAMTAVEIVLLLCGGMPVFDSFVISFGTAGTGGFAITNNSMAAYNVYVQAVVAVFMMLFGVNFNLFYLLLMREFKAVWKSEELRWYVGIMLGSALLITVNVAGMFSSVWEAFHHAFFQVSSVMTTTGFATVDYGQWPEFSRILLVLLMVVGASAGSTGGGVKVSRIIMLWKSLKNGMRKLLHPTSVRVVKMDGKVMGQDVIQEVQGFFAAYCAIMAVSIVLVSLNNLDFETTVTSVFACLNNIGPGLGVVGPVGNYGSLSYLSKIVLSADMLIGRLEIFPMIMLFSPLVWRRHKR